MVRPALSEVEPMDFPGIGTLEAFNTDGLRTLLTTVDVPEMREKTLRYPGHVDRMRMLRESGFFSQEPLELSAAAGRGGETVSVRPLDLTARLLFDQWALGPGEEDLTIFRVDVESVHQGARWLDRFDLLDRLDPETGVHSMARTTGYTCSSIGRLLAKGQYRETGVFAPEHVGQAPGCFEAVMNDLSARGVRFEHSRHELPPA